MADLSPKEPYSGKSADWREGYNRAILQKQIDTRVRHSSEFLNGFQEGLNLLFLEGKIDAQKAAWLAGQLEPAFPAPVIFDPVKVPEHYNTGKIEVANFIADQGLDYVRGNVIKYVSRAGKKNPEKELEDLEKAAAYLQMAYNTAQGKPAVVRDPETKEVVWSLFKN